MVPKIVKFLQGTTVVYGLADGLYVTSYMFLYVIVLAAPVINKEPWFFATLILKLEIVSLQAQRSA
jgi:hypothetical protein